MGWGGGGVHLAADQSLEMSYLVFYMAGCFFLFVEELTTLTGLLQGCYLA